MKHIRLFSLFAVLLALTACGGTDPDVPEETIEVTDYVFSKPSFVFGFSGQKRYSYCPSVIANADGTSHVYFCGNPNQGTMVDNIYHIVENANGTHRSRSYHPDKHPLEDEVQYVDWHVKRHSKCKITKELGVSG